MNCRVFEGKVVFPLDLQRIADAQLTDKRCNKYKEHSKFSTIRSAYGPQLLPKGDCIVVPLGLQEDFVDWYHKNLNNPGQLHMYATIKQNC